VNCIIPGAIETEMSGSLPAEILQSVIDMVPMKKMGQGEDIAEAVKYLASAEAGYVTGALLPVAGGLLMM
jgi:3-oxoacyl-[acyl-carrier protein] reductase